MLGEVVVQEGLLIKVRGVLWIGIDQVQHVLKVPLHDEVGLKHEYAGVERGNILSVVCGDLFSAERIRRQAIEKHFKRFRSGKLSMDMQFLRTV